MLPYYVTITLPGADRPEFLLMLRLSVAGKNQMDGWYAGPCDGDNYGKMVVFRFRKEVSSTDLRRWNHGLIPTIASQEISRFGINMVRR
jgi:uncharacterized membrane protein (UPF0182 family)